MSMNDANLIEAPSSALYRTIWRWHFFAGLITLPFVILLSVTGGIYLFKDEIDRWINPHRHLVTVESETWLPEKMVDAIEKQNLGHVISYQSPKNAESSAIFLTVKDEVKWRVFVNPYTGNILDTVERDGELMRVILKLHSLEYFGSITNYLTELAAGWIILLSVSGLYLWWPRGRKVGVTTIRLAPGSRKMWRDIHAVTGLYAAGFILFLAITGMPWSVFWGGKVNQYLTAWGMGYPEQVWDAVPTSTIPQSAKSATNWTLENAPVPLSSGQGQAIGLNQAVKIVQDIGLVPGFAIDLPDGETGVYTAMVFPDDVRDQRVLHLDQYSGQEIVGFRLSDYGLLAQIFEWGISIHMGQQFGLVNQLVMLGACIAMMTMSVAAVVMWWKRRPKGQLAAPRAVPGYKIGWGLMAIVVAMGIIFPLVGASIIVVFLTDSLFRLVKKPATAS